MKEERDPNQANTPTKPHKEELAAQIEYTRESENMWNEGMKLIG